MSDVSEDEAGGAGAAQCDAGGASATQVVLEEVSDQVDEESS